MTNAPTTDFTMLFSYLFIIVIGTVWIVALTGQRILTGLALIIVVIYSLPHLSLFGTNDDILLLFAYAFSAVFFIVNTLGIIKLKDKRMIPDLLTAAGNGLFLLIWIITNAQDEWKSLIISAWMVVFAAGAFVAYRITKNRAPFYVYAGIGIAMLAAATAEELEGAALTIAYTVEAGLISLITYVLMREVKIVEKMSFLFIVPVILSMESVFSRAWLTGVIHKDFFVILILGLTFFGVGLSLRLLVPDRDGKESHNISNILLVAGSLYAYALIWLSLHAVLVNDDTAVMVSLFIFTVIGLMAYFYGRTTGNRGLTIYGGVMLGSVVARLLLVDVWKMRLTGRIITFFIVGAMLMSTAFLGRKKNTGSLPESSNINS